MYTVEKQAHEASLWSVKNNLLVIADCLRASDARAIADALNEREAMRAEVERLNGAFKILANIVEVTR